MANISAPLACSLLLFGSLLASHSAAAREGQSERDRCLESQPVDVLRPCEEVFSDNPGDSAVKRQLAWSYLANYRESDAIRLFEELALAEPRSGQAQYDLASVLVALRAYPEAAYPLKRAIQLRPFERRTVELAAIYFEHMELNSLAFDMHMRLASLGSLVGMFELANDFAFGRGTEHDQLRAKQWYTRAAEGGHVTSMLVLAEKLERGAFGIAPNPDEAAYWRLRAKKVIAN